MKKPRKLEVVPKTLDAVEAPESAPTPEPTLAPVATRYRVFIQVEPADGGRGAVIKASDDRLEVGSFASASELAWAMTEVLEGVVKLFPEHHPAEIADAAPVTKN